MPKKRTPARKARREQLAPLPVARPWYHAPLTLAANGLAGLLGIFRRPKPDIAKPPQAAHRRRKK